MKHHALFSSKDKSKKLKCRLLQFLFSALRVKTDQFTLKVLNWNMRSWTFKTKFCLKDVALKAGVCNLVFMENC